MGGVMAVLGLDNDLEAYAREVGRVENRLLWAHKQGMEFPPYILKALSGECRSLPGAARARLQVRHCTCCWIWVLESWRKLFGWPSLAVDETYADSS